MPTPEYDKFFHRSLDGLCIAGIGGAFREVNPAFQTMVGYSEDELLAIAFFDLIHSDDLQATRSALEHISKGMGVSGFENRYRCKDGSWKWIEWTAPALEPGSDTIYAVARDVSARKHFEELRETLIGRFRTIVDYAPVAVLLVSRDGAIVHVNKAATALFEYEVEELIGQPVEMLMAADKRAEHALRRSASAENLNARMMGSGQEFLALRKSGRETQVEIGLVPVDVMGSQVTVAFVLDISERKRVDAERDLMRTYLRAGENAASAEGHIKICCFCRKVHDSEDRWKPVEEALSETLGLQFTSGYCPSCVAEQFPELSPPA